MSYTAWLPTSDEDGEFLRHLRAFLDEGLTLVTAEAPPRGVTVDGLVRGVPSDEQLAACPQLRHLFIPYAGLPGSTRERLAQRPEVAVHNLHHNAASTAELAMALLLAVAKRVVPFDRELRSGDWRGRYGEPSSTTLEGGHALVLGYGAIGQRVTRACRGLGMRVSAVRRRAHEGDLHGEVALAPPSALPRLLPTADAVVVCLPLTADTQGLLDAVALAAMKPTACVVNVGRGPIVEERALYEALCDGRLAGAGLDVWYRYPRAEQEREQTLPSDLPFHELDNVVLSPHRAGLTRQNERARARALAGLLRRAAAGEDLPHRVDLEAGY